MMIRRPKGLLGILLLIPAVTIQAGLPVPGPPSTMERDLWIAAALFAAGVVGLLILRLMGVARPRILRLVCWLLVIGGPAFYVIRASAEAAEHAKVKRTMADIRRIATGWDTCAQELYQPKSAGGGITFVERSAKTPTVLSYAVTSQQMASWLVPRCMESFPMRDAWGNDWLLAHDQPFPLTGREPSINFAIASPGRDGRFGPPINGNEPCAAWECDIVYANGVFITQFPAGDDSHDYQ